MAAPEPIKVVVADDHAVVRRGVVEILRRDPRLAVVDEAEDGAQAIQCFRRHRPDVTIMDLRMPNVDGVQATRAIRDMDAHARILILSATDSEDEVLRALRVGASGFVAKHAGCEQLVDATIATFHGARHLSAALAGKLAQHRHGESLSDRELDVLRLIATGLSNKEVGARAGITEGTVKFHVNNILAKMHCTSRTEAVACGLRRGLVSLP